MSLYILLMIVLCKVCHKAWKTLVNLYAEGKSSELSLRKAQVVIGFHSNSVTISGQVFDMF